MSVLKASSRVHSARLDLRHSSLLHGSFILLLVHCKLRLGNLHGLGFLIGISDGGGVPEKVVLHNKSSPIRLEDTVLSPPW